MPSTSMLDSKISRLQRELKQFESQHAKELKEESDALSKINKAQASINRTKSTSTMKNKRNEIQRENKKSSSAKEKQSKLATKISKKRTELQKAQADLQSLKQKEQDKLFKQQERKLKEFKYKQSVITSDDNFSDDESQVQKEYDVFISHSSDDKDGFVNDLAKAIKEADISIWYDSDSIGWGKSIRQEIDKGLRHSRYGIVVISPSFIDKYWTNYELDGILNKESSSNQQMLLPIWHNVTADQVNKYSYSLSDKLALNSGINTINEIVENIKNLLK
ncbi:hypothetical protein J416_08262 [Gracilibacillus halophilus YIM-C55.5]|uniref:ADP-ribosyl cyclase/cyclic ADP-ribose hydrolase n=1 Tax=Gracilibacillus halophilus YIM-C55.5 TaxID=1308866 RepID=N4WUU9_9BACI|nr:toll/interleukin-1 receptor domain-containing protein [Gracilibacillus halophilus]ENH96891.1 hypothetical protein J416_08262 [Gracilibacillus halophilus YIM-C55.5]